MKEEGGGTRSGSRNNVVRIKARQALQGEVLTVRYFLLLLNASTFHATFVSLIKPPVGSKLIYRAGRELIGTSISRVKCSVVFTLFGQ